MLAGRAATATYGIETRVKGGWHAAPFGIKDF